MLKSKRIRLNVLCEDSMHVRFVRRLASDRWKMDPRQVVEFAAPRAKGSKSQYVLDNVVDAVRDLTARSHDPNVKLLIVIDGDEVGLQRRRQQIAERLAVAGLTPLDPSDPRSAILVPCWHMETWIAWLCGHRPIDESTRYKPADGPVGRLIAGGEYSVRRAVAAWLPAASDEHEHVPSLPRGRDELRRLGLQG